MEDSKDVRQIPVEDIVPNRFQPRISFDEKALGELAESIKQHGIIQPLVVRPLGDKFEIIAGERRFKAANIAGLTKVPAIVTNMDDNTSAEVALIENVQRKDLTAIEEAKSYKNMLDRGNMTQEELAKKMGLSQSTIANKLRLLNLSEEVQNALMNEKISERHARALLAISDHDEQVKWLNRVINERLTVRQLDLAIRDELNEKLEEANLYVDKSSNPVQEVDNSGDVPIVNINPDIDSIISNATDINTTEEKPKVDVFEGLDNNINNEEDKKEEIININSELKTNANAVPNKFFNFLEDEEVNMNTSDEEEKNKDNNQVINESIFSFEPELNNQVEQQPIDLNENKFDAFNQNVSSSNDKQEEIDTLDFEPIMTPEVDNEIDNNEKEVSVTNVTEPVINPDNTPNSEVNNNIAEVQKENINVEPIPAVEEEGVLDPVKLFDTLEPDFYEKIKENIGLDLKTAINSYRDLTSDLSNRGFNISIEEIDADNSYKIQIDITKE